MRFSNILWVTFLVANNLCCHAMDGLKNLFGAIEDLAGAVATCEYECPNGRFGQFGIFSLLRLDGYIES